MSLALCMFLWWKFALLECLPDPHAISCSLPSEESKIHRLDFYWSGSVSVGLLLSRPAYQGIFPTGFTSFLPNWHHFKESMSIPYWVSTVFMNLGLDWLIRIMWLTQHHETISVTTLLVRWCQYNVTSHLNITYSGKGCKTLRAHIISPKILFFFMTCSDCI